MVRNVHMNGRLRLSAALKWLNLTIFLASVITIAVVMNVFAQRPDFRSRIDSTKTRAYSLSEQTRRMLGSLDGQWTVAVLLTEDTADRAVRRQVDEVLARFAQASENITVTRFDPTDPHRHAEYESLLSRLRATYAELTAEYEEHLDVGAVAFEELLLFAQQHSGALDELINHAAIASPEAMPQLQQAMQRAQTLGLLAEQGAAVLETAEEARTVSDAQPIPDYDAARSVLAHALNASANELYETAESFRAWGQREDMPIELRRHAANVRPEFERLATELARVAEPLVHLPPLELSQVGRQLSRGEVAIVLSPGRAAVIPSDQLIAKSNIRRAGESVTFDQRFRGEQLIAAAMRSLMVEHMPMVVFVHAEERSMLRPRDRQVDLVGVANVLAASRFEVREWVVPDAEAPTAQPGQSVVYVVIPPPRREGLEPSGRERQLIAAAQRLISEGEPVLLSVYPSLLPRMGQPDPWARIAQPLGMRVDTSRVIVESMRTATDQVQIIKSQTMQQFERGSAIASAIHGQHALFNLPTAIELEETSSQHEIIAAVKPGGNRWLETQWELDGDHLQSPADDSEQRFDQPLPLVVAATRPHPVTRGEQQRAMLVSTGGWMLSYIADAAEPIGGDRLVLLNPAHHELMLASVAWLAGMDDLIAQSPTSQDIARIGEVSPLAGRIWTAIVLGGLPLGSLTLGTFVWILRRR